jgi:hypothetical protein
MSTSSWQPIRLLEVAPVTHKATEPDDPLEMIGVPYPSDPEVDRYTAQCIVEEYALIGFAADDVRRLFMSPNYAALYSLFLRYGDEFVDESIATVFTAKGHS